MQVLDDLGDRSEPATREQYFNEIDKDRSGAIDFEEFLAVRTRCPSNAYIEFRQAKKYITFYSSRTSFLFAKESYLLIIICILYSCSF